MKKHISGYLLILNYGLTGRPVPKNVTDQESAAELSNLLSLLRISASSARPRQDETELTALIRSLLTFSGGKAYPTQHIFSAESTAKRNAELLASLQKANLREDFESINVQKVMVVVAGSLGISWSATDTQDLHSRITDMIKSVRLGFEEGYLVSALECTICSFVKLARISHCRCVMVSGLVRSRNFTAICE